MVSNFYEDLEKGRVGEVIVKDAFSRLTDDFTFVDVGAERDFFYCGDIKAIDKSGKEIFIEVKNDSCIHKTKNVLCEDEVYYKKHDYYVRGNMHNSGCNIYCVVSLEDRKIYVMDFKILQDHYHKGLYKEIEHPEQMSICYLLPLDYIEKVGGLIAVVEI